MRSSDRSSLQGARSRSLTLRARCSRHPRAAGASLPRGSRPAAPPSSRASRAALRRGRACGSSARGSPSARVSSPSRSPAAASTTAERSLSPPRSRCQRRSPARSRLPPLRRRSRHPSPLNLCRTMRTRRRACAPLPAGAPPSASSSRRTRRGVSSGCRRSLPRSSAPRVPTSSGAPGRRSPPISSATTPGTSLLPSRGARPGAAQPFCGAWPAARCASRWSSPACLCRGRTSVSPASAASACAVSTRYTRTWPSRPPSGQRPPISSFLRPGSRPRAPRTTRAGPPQRLRMRRRRSKPIGGRRLRPPKAGQWCPSPPSVPASVRRSARRRSCRCASPRASPKERRRSGPTRPRPSHRVPAFRRVSATRCGRSRARSALASRAGASLPRPPDPKQKQSRR